MQSKLNAELLYEELLNQKLLSCEELFYEKLLYEGLLCVDLLLEESFYAGILYMRGYSTLSYSVSSLGSWQSLWQCGSVHC
jgi:hypothetical protein